MAPAGLFSRAVCFHVSDLRHKERKALDTKRSVPNRFGEKSGNSFEPSEMS